MLKDLTNFLKINFLDFGVVDGRLLIVNYSTIFTTFVFFSIILALILIIVLAMMFLNVAFFFNKQTVSSELESTYECGFIPLSSDFYNFNVNFKNISILFIIFDLEIVFLLPWAVSFLYIGYTGFYVMVMFFAILAAGLYLEDKMSILAI